MFPALHENNSWSSHSFATHWSYIWDIELISVFLSATDLHRSHNDRSDHCCALAVPFRRHIPCAETRPLSVPTPFFLRPAPDHRTLLAKNAESRRPLPGLQPHPPTKNRVHLPFDAVPHSMLFLLGPDELASLPVTSQNLLAELYPEPPEGQKYTKLRQRYRDLLMQEWKARAPAPDRYPYPPSLKPHPFIGRNKFCAGRLHQMISGKSYLRAHLSWDNDNPTTCPKCSESPETFEHAILSCPATEAARNRHLQAITELGPDPPVWSSAALLGALSRFIRSIRTGFPPGILSGQTSAASSASPCSSNVVSVGYFMSSQER